MLLVNFKKGKVAIVGKKQKKMTTNVPCTYEGLDPETGFHACSGCLNGCYDELEKEWIFRCNECGKEAGRGKIEKEGKKA